MALDRRYVYLYDHPGLSSFLAHLPDWPQALNGDKDRLRAMQAFIALTILAWAVLVLIRRLIFNFARNFLNTKGKDGCTGGGCGCR
jgi:hypothetical protein